MSSRNIVRENHPVAFSIIRNAKRNNKLSHAYLISADKKQDADPVAFFILQAIVCEQNGVLVCEECSSCKRIIENKYADMQFIDGSIGIIKKDMVIKATSFLTQTPLEKKGKRILFVKNIELANNQSVNSLLKFIEEPLKDTYIIITTNKLTNVLPTIKSRTQTIKLRPKKLNKLVEELIDKRIDEKYATLLAQIYPNSKEALESYEFEFIPLFQNLKKFIQLLIVNKNQAYSNFKKIFIKKTNYKLHLEILEVFLNDIWKFNVGQTTSCGKLQNEIKNFAQLNYNFSKVIEDIWYFRNSLLFNVNFDLAKEKLLIHMMEV